MRTKAAASLKLLLKLYRDSMPPGAVEAVEDILSSQLNVENKATAKDVVTWLWDADQGTLREVWVQLGASSHARHANLSDALYTMSLTNRMGLAKRTLRRVRELAQPVGTDWGHKGIVDIVDASGILGPVPVLETRAETQITVEDMRQRLEYLEAALCLKDEVLETLRYGGGFLDPPVYQRRIDSALNATPESAKNYTHRLAEELKAAKEERNSYYTAYERLRQESGIVRNALWRKIDRLTRVFLAANHHRRKLRGG